VANPTHQRVALLPIHPRFADAILAGTKRVEFRRVGFATAPTHVVVYATSPVMKVVCWFRVVAIEHAAPSTLWGKYRHVAGISHKDFGRYFKGTRRGVAIRVGKVVRPTSPLPLKKLGVRRPPQGFQYLSEETLETLTP
jgi:predicted transcriptional regulator